MASGYTVSALTNYVNVNKDTLIKDVVLGYKIGDSISRMSKQLGVKETEKLNYLNVDPVLQAGKGCGFNPSGDTAFSERDVTAKILKVNDQWCPDALIGKYAEYLVKLGANKNADNMPFEQEIMDEIQIKLSQKLEKMVWQGDTGLSFTGLIGLAEGADSASTSAVTLSSAATIYANIKSMVMAIPEEILDDAVIFVSPANYRSFIQEMVEKNYYHYESGKIENDDFIFPGTNIAVHKTLGMTGVNDKIYASTYKNLVYACDMLDDKEEFRLWFSDDDDLFKLKIKFNAGVTTYFPDMVVLGTIA
jgi:hypothetical protein